MKIALLIDDGNMKLLLRHQNLIEFQLLKDIREKKFQIGILEEVYKPDSIDDFPSATGDLVLNLEPRVSSSDVQEITEKVVGIKLPW